MPSKSKAQQKFMGAVYALKKGDVKPSDVTPAVRKVAKDMKKSDAKDFASTKHKGLPKKVKQEIVKRLKQEQKVGYPQVGNYAIPSFAKKRKHGEKDNLGKRNKNGNSGQPDLEEGMFSTIDQIRKDSKNVKDFVKNVFADRDFKKMRNDKEFVKYLKSIYEGGSFQRGTQSKPPHRLGGLNHHVLNKTTVRKKDGNANFKKKHSGQEDLDELSTAEKVELYSLYSKAMKSMPGSPKQKKIKQQINKIRVKHGMKPLKENTLNEIGVFPVQNYFKGILPSKSLDISNDRDRERVKSLIKDLVFTLNDFWKSHKIPFRVREPRKSDLTQFKKKNKRY